MNFDPSLQAGEKELREKRELLLEKNQQLDSLSSQMQVVSLEMHDSDSEGEEPIVERNTHADLIDDIMLLNEEVEVLDSHVTAERKHLQILDEVVKEAHFEDMGGKDEHQASAELALELVSSFGKLKDHEFRLHELVKLFEELRKQHNFSDTPLQYMLQLLPLPGKEEVEERKKWLHTLPDR